MRSRFVSFIPIGILLVSLGTGASVANSAPKNLVPSCKTTNAIPHEPIYVAPPLRILETLPTQISLHTNCGTIEIETVGQAAPITLTVLSTLFQAGFYDESLCHRITTEGIFVIQCGDPTATGSGGPNFRYKDENLPIAAPNNYPAGTVGMANSGPNTNGSQFFITFKDSTIGPNYTIWGSVKKGLKIIEKIAAQGTLSGNSDGFPKQKIAIEKASVIFPRK